MTGNFFAVSADRFADACELGIGHATCYLVLACGTGRDHVTTAWSRKAIGKHAGINDTRARRFIGEMEQAGLLASHGSTAKPRYTLTAGDHPIWLPNTVVTGVDDEASPVWRIRQTRNVDVLKAFVHLYDNQNLGIDGGIHPEILVSKYEAEELGEVGACRVFAVIGDRQMRTNWQHAQEAPWRRDRRWNDLQTLNDLGLLVEAVHAFDGPVTSADALGADPEGEFVYSLAGPSGEESLEAVFEAYLQGFEQDWLEAIADGRNNHGDYLALVPKHIEHPHFAGIYRMRHTARTKAASQWWARIMDGRRNMAKILR